MVMHRRSEMLVKLISREGAVVISDPSLRGREIMDKLPDHDKDLIRQMNEMDLEDLHDKVGYHPPAAVVSGWPFDPYDLTV